MQTVFALLWWICGGYLAWRTWVHTRRFWPAFWMFWTWPIRRGRASLHFPPDRS